MTEKSSTIRDGCLRKENDLAICKSENEREKSEINLKKMDIFQSKNQNMGAQFA
jgi:hypothetical protein